MVAFAAHQRSGRDVALRSCLQRSETERQLSARHRPAAPRQCRRVLRRLARSLLHDSVHRRGGEARRRHAHRRMDAHRRVISGVLHERRRTVDGLPFFRHSGARRQLALLHRIRFRMRCRQAARRLDLRGECVLRDPCTGSTTTAWAATPTTAIRRAGR